MTFEELVSGMADVEHKALLGAYREILAIEGLDHIVSISLPDNAGPEWNVVREATQSRCACGRTRLLLPKDGDQRDFVASSLAPVLLRKRENLLLTPLYGGQNGIAVLLSHNGEGSVLRTYANPEDVMVIEADPFQDYPEKVKVTTVATVEMEAMLAEGPATHVFTQHHGIMIPMCRIDQILPEGIMLTLDAAFELTADAPQPDSCGCFDELFGED